MKSKLDVGDIIKNYLEEKGFHGLVYERRECACSLEDLMPCGNMTEHCMPGWMAPCDCGDHDFHIVTSLNEKDENVELKELEMQLKNREAQIDQFKALIGSIEGQLHAANVDTISMDKKPLCINERIDKVLQEWTELKENREMIRIAELLTRYGILPYKEHGLEYTLDYRVQMALNELQQLRNDKYKYDTSQLEVKGLKALNDSLERKNETYEHLIEVIEGLLNEYAVPANDEFGNDYALPRRIESALKQFQAYKDARIEIGPGLKVEDGQIRVDIKNIDEELVEESLRMEKAHLATIDGLKSEIWKKDLSIKHYDMYAKKMDGIIAEITKQLEELDLPSTNKDGFALSTVERVKLLAESYRLATIGTLSELCKTAGIKNCHLCEDKECEENKNKYNPGEEIAKLKKEKQELEVVIKDLNQSFARICSELDSYGISGTAGSDKIEYITEYRVKYVLHNELYNLRQKVSQLMRDNDAFRDEKGWVEKALNRLGIPVSNAERIKSDEYFSRLQIALLKLEQREKEAALELNGKAGNELFIIRNMNLQNKLNEHIDALDEMCARMNLVSSGYVIAEDKPFTEEAVKHLNVLMDELLALRIEKEKLEKKSIKSCHVEDLELQVAKIDRMLTKSGYFYGSVSEGVQFLFETLKRTQDFNLKMSQEIEDKNQKIKNMKAEISAITADLNDVKAQRDKAQKNAQEFYDLLSKYVEV